MFSKMVKLTTLAAAGAMMVGISAGAAETPEQFYAGKTVTVYVGLSPGGGYDTNARLVAKHIGKYIPGHPDVIVKNMPGGGGLVMTNYVANVAPKDGLHIGAPQRGIPFEPLLGDASHTKFDTLKLNWLGSVNADTSVAVVTKQSGITKWQDLLNKEVIVAGTGVGTESVTVPYILRAILGFKYKVIAGYPGGSEMNLAMQRGEVDGRGTYSWTSLKPHIGEVKSGELIVLYQMGLQKHPDLKDVPLVLDLAKTDEQRKMLTVEFTAFQIGRPLFVAEGVPADRVQVLRRAFDAAMKDKDLLADAEKQKQEVNPTNGEDMQKILVDVFATPKPLLDKLHAAAQETPDLKQIPADQAKAKGKGGKEE
ncbi:MAG TPA: tripartite tricarboxylate transporter substrate-binding protein [Xanthobacteraceae bacterium]|nr:tripartite tricarboxylate transporter substrate-binding protein [Xanthobacteraceae bacterium]